MVPAILCVVGALLAHVSVNAFNEYSDFRSGLDLKTQKTPFSGGSGALPEAPGMANAVLRMAQVTLGLTVLIGCYFIWLRGVAIIPFGLVGVVLVVLYTDKVTRMPLWCLIAPGLGFGVLMVLGAHVALSGMLSLTAVFASLVPFFQVNNLLLLNQFPDIDADREVGRYHFPIAFGVENAVRIYALFQLCAALTIVIAVATAVFPDLALLALLPMLPTVLSWHGARELGKKVSAKPQYMALNVVANILTPVVLGAVLLLV
jgi:1,4-dihydroxy-2-naphthoate octaprenyltransferase